MVVVVRIVHEDTITSFMSGRRHPACAVAEVQPVGRTHGAEWDHRQRVGSTPSGCRLLPLLSVTTEHTSQTIGTVGESC